MNTSNEFPSDSKPMASAPYLEDLDIIDETSQIPHIIPPFQSYPSVEYAIQSPYNVYAPSYPSSTSQIITNTTYPPQLYSPSNTTGCYPPYSGEIHQAYAASYSYNNYSVQETSQYAPYPEKNNRQSETIHEKEYGNPTVYPAEHFNPIDEASILATCLISGTIRKDIFINILCKRSLQQRLIIAEEYKKNNGELIQAFEVKLSGNFKELMKSLITPLDILIIQDLEKAISRHDFNVVPEIICTISNEKLRNLKSAYQSMFSKTIESGISDKAVANCKELLLEICECNRDESCIVNAAQAETDAIHLYGSTNENYTYFMDIFTKRNYQQIKLICEVYEKRFPESIDQKIKNTFSFFDQQGYLVIHRFASNKHEFYAKRLHQSMKGIGTNDEQLIRLIVIRSEIDLKDIKDAFHRIIKETLKEWIEDDTSGHYKKALLSLIGE